MPLPNGGFALFCTLRSIRSLSPRDPPSKLAAGLAIPAAVPRSRPTENPHEEQLNDVRVEKEELRALVLLRPRVERVVLHRASVVLVVLWQEDVLERAHLTSPTVSRETNPIECIPLMGRRLTRNSELAKKV